MPKRYQNGKLEVRKDVSRPYYFVRVTIPVIGKDGKRMPARKPQPIGFLDEITKAQAMKVRSLLLEKVNAPRMLAQSDMLFSDVCQRFIEVRVPQLGVAVQQRYPSQIKKHLLPAFGPLKMREIDRPMVEGWLNEKKLSGAAPWTLTGLKGVLSSVFTTAKSWRIWEGGNPCEGIRVKKGAVREKRKLTADQLIAIQSVLADRERFIVQILFGLGLRISECLGLKWCDVDTEAGSVQIRRRWYRGDLSEDGENKSEAGTRVLQLGQFLSGEFKRRYPGPHKINEFVFLAETGGLPPDDRDILREYFRPAIRRLGLYYKGFGWHAFRRNHITARQVVGGATPIEAMKSAGHASLDMTALYTLLDPSRESDQVDKIMNQVTGSPANRTAN